MQAGEKELVAAAPALFASVLRRFGAARLRVSGGSMFPAIRPGDVVEVRRCAVGDLRTGDIVLVRDGARLIVHRLLRFSVERGAPVLVLRGDSLWTVDPPRPASALLGRVVAVARRGARTTPRRCTGLGRLRGLAVSESIRLRQMSKRLVRTGLRFRSRRG